MRGIAKPGCEHEWEDTGLEYHTVAPDVRCLYLDICIMPCFSIHVAVVIRHQGEGG